MTSDGKFYSYLLNYSSQPSYLNLRVALSSTPNESVIIFNPEGTTDKVQQAAQTGEITKEQARDMTPEQRAQLEKAMKEIGRLRKLVNRRR